MLPATLMTVVLMDPHVPDGGSLAIPLGVFWVGPFFLWSICRYFDLPRTAALLAGCMAMTGIYGFMAAFSFSFFGASGNHAALGKESWSTLGAVTAITGIIVAGLVAGVVHFRAMRRGWRRSYRNGLALLLAIGGPILLMIASHAFAIALIQSAKSAAAQATSGS